MSRLTLPVPRDFLLHRAVCSYGYFVLAPNHWVGDTRTLHRPLQVSPKHVTNVAITQSKRTLTLRCDTTLTRDEAKMVKQQVTRMLRIDDDMSAWYALCPEARRIKYGRLFRSPSFFEDAVKTITGCNVAWPNTVRMNKLLCERFGERGAFPTPGRLARVKPGVLQAKAKVGYRAERIVRLARDIDKGGLDPAWFEHPDRTTEELYDALRAIYGIGDYAAGNLLMLLGRYDHVAIDSETYRHYCKLHDIKRPKKLAPLDRRIRKHYGAFHPYTFLAYWFELWNGYEQHVSKPATQWTKDDATAFTASKYR